jgi:hypothetical protein
MLDGLDRDPLASLGGDLERGQRPARVPGRQVATSNLLRPDFKGDHVRSADTRLGHGNGCVSCQADRNRFDTSHERPWPTAIVLVYSSVCEE